MKLVAGAQVHFMISLLIVKLSVLVPFVPAINFCNKMGKEFLSFWGYRGQSDENVGLMQLDFVFFTYSPFFYLSFCIFHHFVLLISICIRLFLNFDTKVSSNI